MTRSVQRSVSRRAMLGLLAAGGFLSREGGAVAAGGSSEWSPTDHARMRLLDGGRAQAGGGRIAGIEIALDPDFLTYWRTPGEAGVPPTADFAGSSNLGRATLLFPAPGRFDEGGAEAFGYKTGVVFPVLIEPADAAIPVDLAVAFDFAVCSKLCLPVQAKARLALTTEGSSPEAESVRATLSSVPLPRPVGGDGPLAIDHVTLDPDGKGLSVVARTADDAAPSLFPEAPDPWFLQADAGSSAGPGLTRFALRLLARPDSGSNTLPLRLTLVGSKSAIEVAVDLDVSPNKPVKTKLAPENQGLLMTIEVGQSLPQATFYVTTEGGVEPKTTDDIFKGKKVILFAVPGRSRRPATRTISPAISTMRQPSRPRVSTRSP